jgi:hypothetical protein
MGEGGRVGTCLPVHGSISEAPPVCPSLSLLVLIGSLLRAEMQREAHHELLHGVEHQGEIADKQNTLLVYLYPILVYCKRR